MKFIVTLLALFGAAETAQAANCKALADRVANLTLEQVAPTFAELAKCDSQLAAERFPDFMRRISEAGALVTLSVTALDAGIEAPIHSLLDQISDYGARDEVAKGIGEACAEHPSVVGFLRGAHGALGERQFAGWREALSACEAPELVSWLAEAAAAPSNVPYDEKYDMVARALVDHQGVEALPVLEKAAVKAGNGSGPFVPLLDRMGDAIRPSTIGGTPSAEHREQLEQALVRVAGAVPAEQARLVADRLYQAGAEKAAVELLPRIYPERVQADGGFLYGVASVEHCSGQAFVHYAVATEPGTRWTVYDDLQQPARSFKKRLKCTTDGEWPVVATHEPLASAGDVEAWAQEVVAEWSGKGLTVKSRAEKPISLH